MTKGEFNNNPWTIKSFKMNTCSSKIFKRWEDVDIVFLAMINSPCKLVVVSGVYGVAAPGRHAL
jgi:hypothetical protein